MRRRKHCYMFINGPAVFCALRGHVARASLRKAAGLSHLLIVFPLTAFPSLNQLLLLQNRFNNTCQLLKCLGFVLWLISLTGVIRTTNQLLLASWQWCACYRLSEMIHTKGRNDLVKEGWEVFRPKRSHDPGSSPKSRNMLLFGFLHPTLSSSGCKPVCLCNRGLYYYCPIKIHHTHLLFLLPVLFNRICSQHLCMSHLRERVSFPNQPSHLSF